MKNIGIKKLCQNKFFILLIPEGIILLFLLPGLFRPLESVMIYDGEGIVHEVKETLEFPNLMFGAGVYEVTVSYEAMGENSSTISVTDGSGIYKGLYANDIPLTSGKTGEKFNFWLTGKSDFVNIRITPAEGTELKLREIMVSETHAGNRILIFIWVCVSLLTDGAYLYGKSLTGHKDRRERVLTACALLGIITAVSVPLLVDYCLQGMDLIFHLIRIEGVKEGLLSGQFPVRIQPNWLHGYGYATSVFYGDTFLLIPAALRLIGLPVQTAYRLFLLIINAATALIAYACFHRIFRKRTIGIVGSMLYTWAPYRIYDLYGRAALGEVIALTFLPVLLLGFYLIYTEDITKKEYKNLWIQPAIGFSGIIQSHTLSCEMAGGMVVLLCLILLRKTFRKQTFIVLCKTVLATILLNAWFLIPFLDYYLTGDFVVKHIGAQTIQNRGVYFLHYLFTFFRGGFSSHFNENGMQNTESLGIGFAVTCAVLLYVWQMFVGRYRRKEDERGVASFGRTVAVIGFIVLFMSTNSFPWDALQHSNRVFAVLISSLQFPMRLLTITVLCFTFVACVAVWQTTRWEKTEISRSVTVMIVAIAFVTTQFLLGDMLSTKTPLRIYNAENIGTTYIMGSEYLPVRMNTNLLGSNRYTVSENVDFTTNDEEVCRYGRKALTSCFRVQNIDGQDGFVDAPLTYYKGYRARSMGNGEALFELTVTESDNGQVRVLIPAGFSGNVEVEYVSPWYWRFAEGISVICWLGLFAAWIWRKRRVEKV